VTPSYKQDGRSSCTLLIQSFHLDLVVGVVILFSPSFSTTNTRHCDPSHGASNMGRFLALSALAFAFVPSTYASLAVNYAPVTGVSQDGTCGNGITCVGSEFGNCCSTSGICGSSDGHCGDGCQPLFGLCPMSVLNKRYAEEGAALEKTGLEERALEARSTSACTSASTTAITCVASKTAVIKSSNPTNYRAFCTSWMAKYE